MGLVAQLFQDLQFDGSGVGGVRCGAGLQGGGVKVVEQADEDGGKTEGCLAACCAPEGRVFAVLTLALGLCRSNPGEHPKQGGIVL